MWTNDLVLSWEIQYLAECFEKASGSGEMFSSRHWTKAGLAVGQENEMTDLNSSHTDIFDQQEEHHKCNPFKLNGT